ncbi:hypothetical protein T492DRAFT_920403 [Pavlovales sp. CCMP2436]|nr:hypothetical protein T492DRAFT_920403 [Pavlovales sp. CCMP2436]
MAVIMSELSRFSIIIIMRIIAIIIIRTIVTRQCTHNFKKVERTASDLVAVEKRLSALELNARPDSAGINFFIFFYWWTDLLGFFLVFYW